MTKKLSPLLGYNTNIRHKAKLYHVQTEDSGLTHPHVITHIFADGGRIVATKKTAYQEWVQLDDVAKRVERLMKEQHQNMLRALRDGQYSEAPAGGEDEPARDTIVNALAEYEPAHSMAPRYGREKAVIDKSLSEVLEDLIEEEERML